MLEWRGKTKQRFVLRSDLAPQEDESYARVAKLKKAKLLRNIFLICSNGEVTKATLCPNAKLYARYDHLFKRLG
jgi:hypothetical protein